MTRRELAGTVTTGAAVALVLTVGACADVGALRALGGTETTRPARSTPAPVPGAPDSANGKLPAAPAPDALDCASGHSSGGIADYFMGGGEATAAEAIKHAERSVVLASGGTPLKLRIVENTQDRVRMAFLDPAGTVTGAARVDKVDGKWQIHSYGACAAVGSVGTGAGP